MKLHPTTTLTLTVDSEDDLLDLDLPLLVDIGEDFVISSDGLENIDAHSLTAVHGSQFVITNNEGLNCSVVEAIYCPLTVRPPPTVSGDGSATCPDVNTGC